MTGHTPAKWVSKDINTTQAVQLSTNNSSISNKIPPFASKTNWWQAGDRVNTLVPHDGNSLLEGSNGKDFYLS